MILKNISVLYGNELKLIESTNVQIKNEKFQKISKNISSKEKSIDCSNLLLIPGFVNSHTHIADSIGCLLYTSPSPRDRSLTRMPSSA